MDEASGRGDIVQGPLLWPGRPDSTYSWLPVSYGAVRMLAVTWSDSRPSGEQLRATQRDLPAGTRDGKQDVDGDPDAAGQLSAGTDKS